MTKNELIQYINTYINTNGVRSITGAELNTALLEIISQQSTGIGNKIRFTPTEPPSPSLDDMWIDSDNDNIYIWNGSIWELAINIEELKLHISNQLNPHNVTKEQIGLSNVTNDAQVKRTEMGASNGVATLDGSGKVPVAQLPASVMEYKGAWNASTNTPTLADGVGDSGDVYVVSVAGTQTFGSITYNFEVNDNIMYNGTIWQKTGGSTAQLYLSVGCYVLPTLTNNNNGSITIGNTGEFVLYNNSTHTGIIQKYSVNGNTFTLTDNTTNYIVIDYNAGTPIIRNTLTVTEINESNICPIYTIVRTGNQLHILNWDTLGKGLANKLHQSIVKTQRFRRESGLMLGEVSPNRYTTISSGIVWYGATSLGLNDFNSSINTLFQYTKTGGVWSSTTVTQYNNTQYQNGANLATLTNNRYAVNWIYRGIEADTESYVVLGTGDYDLPQAIASQPPADLPFIITSHAALVGRIIVQKSATTATQIDSAFAVTFSGGGVTSHKNLNDLQGGIAPDELYHLSLSDYNNILTPAYKDYGFVRPDADVRMTHTFDVNTGIFTLNGSILYYRNQVLINGGTTQSVTIPTNVNADYFVFFDSSNPTLTYATTAWSLNDTKVPVALILFRTIPNRAIVLYEPHPADVSRVVHKYLHTTRGTQLVSGGIINGLVLNGNADVDNCWGMGATTISDEGMTSPLNSFTKPSGSGIEYTNIFRSGGIFTFDGNEPVPYKYTGAGYIEYDNAGTLTPLSTGKYMNMYVLAVPTFDVTSPYRYVSVVGQGVFNSDALAYGENWSTLSKAGFPFVEFTVLYQITFETNASFTTKGKCRVNRILQVVANSVATSVSSNTVDWSNIANIPAKLTDYVASSVLYPNSNIVNALNITKTDKTTSIFSVDALNERIGIGTTSPLEKLDISGKLRAQTVKLTNILDYNFPVSSSTGLINSQLNQAPSGGHISAGKSFSIGTSDQNGVLLNLSNINTTTLKGINVSTSINSAGQVALSQINAFYHNHINSSTLNPSITNMFVSTTAQTTTNNPVGVLTSIFNDVIVSSTQQTAKAVGDYIRITGGNVTTAIGSNIELTSVTGATDLYGLKIENITGATNNYSIYTGTGKVYFGGNVGIGTTNPTEKLHITDTGYMSVILEGGANNGAGIQFYGSTTKYAEIFGEYESANKGVMYFRTRDNSDILDTKMTISSNGNVGIGTTSPTAKLTVVGGGTANSIATAILTATSSIRVANPAISLLTGYTNDNNQDTCYLQAVNIDTGFSKNLFINPYGGNVGIGTTSPNGRLQVLGVSGDPILNAGVAAISTFTPLGVGTELVMGSSASSPYTFWMQNRHTEINGLAYPIALNPLGGNVGIGTNNPTSKLSVVGLPTSSAGLQTGDFWNNNGVVNVV